VKPRLFPSSACGLIAICWFLALDRPAAQAKPIRLRNEIILLTEASAPGVVQPKSTLRQPPVSGLVLVQVAGAMTPGWQAELHSLGVEVRFNPNEAWPEPLTWLWLMFWQAGSGDSHRGPRDKLRFEGLYRLASLW
jgi:hypothetical protein